MKVVTDSSSDIPPEVAQELGITVIPMYIRFGDEVYRDGIDIRADDLYKKISRSHRLPKTSIPSPGDFAKVYEQLAENADGILSVHLSPRYSGALNAAMLAKEYVSEKCPVEVIDSRSVSMGCGLAVMAAAREARKGAGLEQVREILDRAIQRTHIVGMIADIQYLLGGRRLSLPGWHLFLGKLGTLIGFKLVGEIHEAGKVRGIGLYLTEAKAIKKLEERITGFTSVAEMAVLHTNKPEWAQSVASRMMSNYPHTPIHVSRLSGATGAHGGPKALAIAFIEGPG